MFWALYLNDKEGIWLSVGMKRAEKEYAEWKGQGLMRQREQWSASLGALAIKSLGYIEY